MLIKIVDEYDFYYEEIYLEIDPYSEQIIIETWEISDIFPFSNQADDFKTYQSNNDFPQINPQIETSNQIEDSKMIKDKNKKGIGSYFKRLFGRKNN